MSTSQEATLDCPDYAMIAMAQGSLGEPGVTLGAKGRLYRDDLGEKRAAIRMRADCRGVVMVAGLIVAGKSVARAQVDR